jgi:hypothetical protein
MDMFHPDFHNSIAVDRRISGILKLLKIPSDFNYFEKETVLVQLAVESGISPWHLDRLLYSYTKYYTTIIAG